MLRQKQVEITDEIVAQIEQVTKTSIDRNNIIVFEAAALSTEPLHKRGSIYHEARAVRSTLEDMVQRLNSGEESVPLHTMHMQSNELPKGRVFQARISDEPNGSSVLRAMFYLPLSERELIEKINLSILDEVSVGLKSKQALCSKCGFDFFGPEADFMNLMTQTCDNDHIIGEDGMHLKLVGIDRWMELSLVSRGASDKPKILSRVKNLVSKVEQDRMAADGKPLEALCLFTSTAMETPQMADKTETKDFDAKAAIEALEAKITELTENLASKDKEPDAELQAQLDAANARVAELEAAADPEPDLQAQLDAANARIAELEAEPEPEPEPEPKTNAAPDVPVGGVAASAVSDAKKDDHLHLRASAFKTNRRA